MSTMEFGVMEGANGDAYLAPQFDVMVALDQAVRDGSATVSFNESGTGQFRVELLDGDEWGAGPDLETALRYALGAHFAPEGS
jgi:hypothetical protein